MESKLGWNVLAPAFLAIVVDAMGYGIVYPMMTELFAGEEGLHMAAGMSLPLRHFYLGLSFLLFPLASFFGASLMGDLSEIYGPKKVLVLCLGGLTVSFVLMGLGVEFVAISMLLIGRALSGLMAGSQPIAQAAIIQHSTSEAQKRNLSLMTIVLAVGIVIGPFIGGIFSDSSLTPFFTLSTPFYLAAALALLTCLWVGAAFPDKEIAQKKSLNWMRPLHLFYEGFTRKEIRLLALIFLSTQIGFSLFFQLIQIFVSVAFDFPSWKIGVFNGYMGIAFAIVILFGVKFLLKFLTVEWLATLSLCVTGICLILPMIFPNQVFVWVMSFLAAGFDMLAYGALMACFATVVGSARPGWVMGVFASIVAAAWTLTGFSTNLINWIGLRWLIAIGGCFVLLSFFLMLIYLKRRKIPA